MAQKRASPLDEPPTASSSEEEEEEEGSTEEQGGSSEEGEEEEQHEPAKPSPPPPPPAVEKKPTSRRPPPATTNSQPRSASFESGSESDSGSDSEDGRPTVVLDPKVKPVASKPMEETSKAKKPRSQSSATPARSTTKRAGENSRQVNDSKRAKKKSSYAVAADEETPAREKSGDDSKKLFQRLWSEDDEIAILKGMVEYSAKNGTDPYKDPNAFHDFIKKSLHVDVSKVQLMDKIRRLKKKYENNAGKGKNGEDRNFSKAHDSKAFELSKKIWGTEGTSGVAEQVKSNGKARKDKKEGSRSRTVLSLKAELLPSPNSKEAGKMDIDQSSGSILSLSEMIRFDKNLGVSALDEDIMKKGLELIGASKREELEERWKKLRAAELEIYVKRTELIKDQAKLIWEAYKSSNH